MKKALALILVMCLTAALFTACGGGKTSSPADDGDSSGIQVDEKLLNVDITLPASLFEDDEDFDADTYAQEQGFIKAVVNEDGSVTITMTKAKYNELLKELTEELNSSFAEMVEAEDTPYIKEITHNDDFSVVNVKVNREAYESAFDFTPLAIGLSTMIYQAFLEMDNHCEINMVDADTGDIIKTVVYPDAYEG